MPENAVVIIGSGATAVTLLPAMAQTASHVTMLQRSPTYIVTLPAQDKIAELAPRLPAPAMWAYPTGRWKNVALMMYIDQLAQRRPNFVKTGIIAGRCGPNWVPITTWPLTSLPATIPWEQRLCVVPDGDMFQAIRSGRASIVTHNENIFRLNGHHLLHHRYMGKNFNVVLPLADLCCCTLLLRSRVAFAQAQGPSVPDVQPKGNHPFNGLALAAAKKA